MPSNPFHGLSLGTYGAILADPPWAFKTYSGKTVTAHRAETDWYTVMDMFDLEQLPVASLAAKDCALFLWVVDSHLDVAIQLGKSWGFVYKTRAFEWVKIKKDVQPGEVAEVDLRISMGYYTRKQCESCLLFTRGKPKRLDKGVRQIIAAPIREHSRKPDEAYHRIERLVAGPYAELFARRYQPNWSGWGEEYL